MVLDLRLDEPESVDGCELVWLEVSDSRCPLGVECIWEGEALVVLSIACDGEAARRVQLSSRSEGESSTRLVFGRRFSLLRVDPTPVDGVRPEREKYRARLEMRVSGEDGS